MPLNVKNNVSEKKQQL